MTALGRGQQRARREREVAPRVALLNSEVRAFDQSCSQSVHSLAASRLLAIQRSTRVRNGVCWRQCRNRRRVRRSPVAGLTTRAAEQLLGEIPASEYPFLAEAAARVARSAGQSTKSPKSPKHDLRALRYGEAVRRGSLNQIETPPEHPTNLAPARREMASRTDARRAFEPPRAACRAASRQAGADHRT